MHIRERICKRAENLSDRIEERFLTATAQEAISLKTIKKNLHTPVIWRWLHLPSHN